MKLTDYENEIQAMMDRNGSCKLDLYDNDNDSEGIWVTANAENMARLQNSSSNGDKVIVYLLNAPVFIMIPWGTAVEATTRGQFRPECHIANHNSWPTDIQERNEAFFAAVRETQQNTDHLT